MGDCARAAQAEARVELQADELRQARLLYEHNQAENDVAYRLYQGLVKIAKDGHEKFRQQNGYLLSLEQHTAKQQQALRYAESVADQCFAEM